MTNSDQYATFSEEEQKEIFARLGEGPTNLSGLWTAYWGDLKIIKQIGAMLTKKDESSRTVLVHGRYGTGKSSFLQRIEQEIEEKSMVLKLNMSSFTGHITSSALAAVVNRIVAKLNEESLKLHIDGCPLSSQVEDLWRIEAQSLSWNCDDPCHPSIPAEHNRMAGMFQGEGDRFVAANTLETGIADCVRKICQKDGKTMSLTVFLDDLDRCSRRVAMDIIRLLLRFSSTENVHFVLACDWDILEQGVKDWMDAYGKADHGGPLVTANSALEKYVHIAVELPDMGAPAQLNEEHSKNWKNEILQTILAAADREIDGSKDNPEYALSLADVLVNELLSKADHD